MDINIALSHAEVECLRRYLPEGSDLNEKIDHSELTYIHPTERPRGHYNVIVCSECEARAFLHIAAEHCPEAVKNIQYAMSVAHA